MKSKDFLDKLKKVMNMYVHRVYDVTEKFPKGELFGLTSQYRRSTLSIILNYIEGYARLSKKIMENFFEISYGSLKESAYLTEFSFQRNYINKQDHTQLVNLADEIGRMLWTVLQGMKQSGTLEH